MSGTYAQGNSPVGSKAQGEAALHVGPAAPVELEGELEVVYQDLKSGQSRLSHTLRLSDGTRVPLRFVDPPPPHLLTGQHVRVSGQLAGGSLILYSANTSTTTTTPSTTTTQTAPLSNTFGAQSTLVILVNFQDAPASQPWTPAQIESAVFASSGLSGYLEEASYGQTSLTGNVYGWYTIPVTSTTCDANQIATAANSAASASGANLSAYARLVYVFPYNSVCGWAGAGTIGGSPSQSWVNGGGTTTNTFNLGIFAHEMGHNLGLYHSHGLNCGSVVLSGQCTQWEYFDTLDVMGSGQGHYNSFQKERLGWLNYGSSPAITTATASGTYILAPYETTGPSSKTLKVLKFTNPTSGLSYYYYVEYRQGVGFDSFVSTMAAQNINGVLVRLAQEGAANSSDLLEMNPSTSSSFSWPDIALNVGATYSDPDAGISITPQSVGSEATINVSISQPGCVRALPGISISPSQPGAVAAGSTVNYTISVTDNDSSSCGASTFNLQPSIVYGWTDTLSASQLTLSPGSSSSAMLSVTSAANSNDGTDTIGVTATNTADFVYAGAASATFSLGVAPPPPPPPPSGPSLAVSLSVSGTSFTPPTTVPISATVMNNGEAASGASVTFTLTAPNNSATTQTATTGSNGVAPWNYRLGSKSAAGVYSVVAEASIGSTNTGGKKGAATAAATVVVSSNPTSFSVQ
jgi:M6 family metalloprotease-like protein